ncbi:hypothetical protein [Schlesneria sp. DSM 10557]|uniref:hypothetical protein n=1 Tax=Schlesneria sp. DSM 10557 TaxID=3044399 RepID=UPI00359FB390
MGVILKYLIDFPDAKFKVSNDLLKGDFLIDVSVKVSMQPAISGTTFEVQLIDLPEAKAKILSEDPKQARMIIKLGYFDGSFETVVEGFYTEVKTQVTGDHMVTTLKGEEVATLGLRHTIFDEGLEGKIGFTSLITKILTNATADEDSEKAGGSVLTAALTSLIGDSAPDLKVNTTPVVKNIDIELNAPSFRGKSVMKVLDSLAERASAEFLVSDKTIRIGKPIESDDYKPAGFKRDVNLAELSRYSKTLPEVTGNGRLKSLPKREIKGFNFRIAGDPKLRPGNQVTTDVVGFTSKDDTFRVHSIIHTLSLSGGYLCEGLAVIPCSDDNCRRQQLAVGQISAEGVSTRLTEKIKDETSRQPVVEVCGISTYSGGNSSPAHQATLQFGQRFEKSETQPSVRAPVDDEVNQVFNNKPLVSSFAWNKCGQITPVYPGMKAVVTHNLGLADDALVTGFIWSENPPFEPPRNEPGDWWLCLPVNFDGKTPTSATNAANDLISNRGHRVIEVSGLRITTGTSTLGTVGNRPEEGNDDEILIEHKPSGSTFHIDPDGAITISGRSGSKFQIDKNGTLSLEANTITIKGDVTITGNVDIQ